MKKRYILPVLSAILVAGSCSSKSNNTVPSGEAIYAESNNQLAVEQNNATINGSRSNAITKAAHGCSPAIVGINVTEVREVNTNPFGNMFGYDPYFEDMFSRMYPKYKQKVQSLGSGFIISPDGYIITNDHVAGRASKIVVTMTDGEKYDAEIIGSDATADVALLKIKGKNLPYIKLGNSDDVMVGEWAIALGNPFGLFDRNSKPTVTVGVISNKGVNFTENTDGTTRVYRNMLQTDAAISSGNSGGPLVNANGEVIGVNTVIFSTAQSNRGAGSIGIGFSIPVNRVKNIVNLLKSGEKLDRQFYTGLSVDFLNEQNAKYYRQKKTEGVIVTQVLSKSPADRAGIEPGDVILEIDGVPMHTNDDVGVAINDAVVGQTLSVKLERDNEVMVKKMTLEKRK